MLVLKLASLKCIDISIRMLLAPAKSGTGYLVFLRLTTLASKPFALLICQTMISRLCQAVTLHGPQWTLNVKALFQATHNHTPLLQDVGFALQT